MVFRLVPREEKFFTLLQDAASNIVSGATALSQLLVEWEDVPRKAAEIKEIEAKGDRITHSIVKLLNATFVTPIDHEDILTMASCLDDIIDRIEAATARLVIFRIKGPTEHSRELARSLCLACEQVSAAIVHFQRKRFREVAQACVEINRLENEADVVHRLALADLFDNGHDAIQVVKLKDLFSFLEDATDRCEDVANVIETIIIKGS